MISRKPLLRYGCASFFYCSTLLAAKDDEEDCEQYLAAVGVQRGTTSFRSVTTHVSAGGV